MVATLKQVRDFIHRSGHCFIAPVPGESDSADAPGVSRLRLFEDGVEIGPPHSSHANIEREGGGRFSHWDGHLYFSSSDASLPTKNNKPYHVLVEQNSDSRTEIDKRTFLALQSGVMKYPYKDILCCKSPIDMALYQMLIWREKPRTILEIGTLKGGSALWFADLLRSYGIDGHVHSLDITPEPKISDPMVRFYRGDILDLGATWPTDWFASLPRPILAIDDAGHHYTMTKAAIEYMARVLRRGEYLVIEDGIVSPMDDGSQYDGGPLRAIDEFLASRSEFELDRSYCDFFGRNVTWSVDGFLRRR